MPLSAAGAAARETGFRRSAALDRKDLELSGDWMIAAIGLPPSSSV